MNGPVTARMALLEAVTHSDLKTRLDAVNDWLATWIESISGECLTPENAMLSAPDPIMFRMSETSRMFHAMMEQVMGVGHSKHVLRVLDTGRKIDPKTKGVFYSTTVELQLVRFPFAPGPSPGKHGLSLVPGLGSATAKK